MLVQQRPSRLEAGRARLRAHGRSPSESQPEQFAAGPRWSRSYKSKVDESRLATRCPSVPRACVDLAKIFVWLEASLSGQFATGTDVAAICQQVESDVNNHVLLAADQPSPPHLQKQCSRVDTVGV